MKIEATPAYALRDNQGVKADLLDRVLQNGERVLKSQGIELGTVGQKQQATTDWESIGHIGNALCGGIMKATKEINQAWAALDGIDYPNKAEVDLQVNTTNEDLAAFADKFVAIKKRHEGKSGLIMDGPDLSLSLGISSDYIMLGEELKALTFPTMLSLTEAVDQAISMQNSNKAKEEA